jgi:hypothetical protein
MYRKMKNFKNVIIREYKSQGTISTKEMTFLTRLCTYHSDRSILAENPGQFVLESLDHLLIE